MKERVQFEKMQIIVILFITILSCTKHSPNETITGIIDATEEGLYDAVSIEEMQQIQFDMLDNITRSLDSEHNGYRYSEGNTDYNKIIERLDRYNIIYCCNGYF